MEVNRIGMHFVQCIFLQHHPSFPVTTTCKQTSTSLHRPSRRPRCLPRLPIFDQRLPQHSAHPYVFPIEWGAKRPGGFSAGAPSSSGPGRQPTRRSRPTSRASSASGNARERYSGDTPSQDRARPSPFSAPSASAGLLLPKGVIPQGHLRLSTGASATMLKTRLLLFLRSRKGSTICSSSLTPGMAYALLPKLCELSQRGSTHLSTGQTSSYPNHRPPSRPGSYPLYTRRARLLN